MLTFRPRTDRPAGRQRKHDPSVRIPFGACRRATYAVFVSCAELARSWSRA